MFAGWAIWLSLPRFFTNACHILCLAQGETAAMLGCLQGQQFDLGGDHRFGKVHACQPPEILVYPLVFDEPVCHAFDRIRQFGQHMRENGRMIGQGMGAGRSLGVNLAQGPAAFGQRVVDIPPVAAEIKQAPILAPQLGDALGEQG